MTKKQMAATLQAVGLGALVVGAGLFALAAAFLTAGVGLVLWGVALEMDGE